MGMPTVFAEIARAARDREQPFHQAERGILGVTHAEVGAYLLGLWGLPFAIVETVAFHHNPSAVTSGPCEVLAVVHVADALVDRCVRTSVMGADPSAVVDMAFLERNGLREELSRWRAIADEESRAFGI
jgi:HD-like signal output (HDOD) protein